MITRLTLVALLAAIASPAFAEGEKREKKQRDPARMQKILDEFDLDGDGQLNQEERAAAREARMARRSEANKGEKGKGEAGKGKGEGRRRGGAQGPRMDPDQMFNSLDANGDGQLSRDEFRSLIQRMQQMRGQQGRRPGPGQQRERRGPRSERPDRPAADDAPDELN